MYYVCYMKDLEISLGVGYRNCISKVWNKSEKNIYISFYNIFGENICVFRRNLKSIQVANCPLY